MAVIFNASTSSGASIAADNSGEIQFRSNNANAVTITSNSVNITSNTVTTTSTNFGINTTSPVSTLQVAGNISLEEYQAIYWNGYWDGSGTRAIAAGYVQQIYGDPDTGNIQIYTSSSSIGAGGVAGQTERLRIGVDAIYIRQVGPTSKSANATLTAAEILDGILSYTGAAATITLPTGTTLDAGVSMTTNLAFDWSVINTGSGNCTIAVNTGIASLGSLVVPTNNSGLFRFRKTATNTFTVYRIA